MALLLLRYISRAAFRKLTPSKGDGVFFVVPLLGLASDIPRLSPPHTQSSKALWAGLRKP